MVNYDWLDMFRNDPDLFRGKLERDKLEPDRNSFFFFSWSHVSYREKRDCMGTVHMKTRLYKVKPLLDLLAIFIIPFTVWRQGERPQAWMSYDFGMLPALWTSKLLFGGKVVLCVSNQPALYSKTRKFGQLKGAYSYVVERLWHRLADHYFTINESMRGYLQSLGIPKAKVTVFYVNTIERDLSFIAKAKKGAIRASLGIPADTKIMLTVARLEAEKDYPRLLKLFASLGKGYVLIALGRGSLLPELIELCSTLDIKDRVIFAGLVGRDKIWDYYLDADVFALLSKAEALGLVFWEAMYMGLTVIGSNADGIVETIGKNGDRGYIMAAQDGEDDFKQKVDFCVMPSRERDLVMARAKEFVETQMKNKVTFNDLPVFND